jgi:hypothetical protein
MRMSRAGMPRFSQFDSRDAAFCADAIVARQRFWLITWSCGYAIFGSPVETFQTGCDHKSGTKKT